VQLEDAKGGTDGRPPPPPRPPPTYPLPQGRPSHEDVEAIDSPFAATMMESCTVTHARRLADMFPAASPEAADLLRWVDGWGGWVG
jgi:hypothetical protein